MIVDSTRSRNLPRSNKIRLKQAFVERNRDQSKRAMRPRRNCKSCNDDGLSSIDIAKSHAAFSDLTNVTCNIWLVPH